MGHIFFITFLEILSGRDDIDALTIDYAELVDLREIGKISWLIFFVAFRLTLSFHVYRDIFVF